MASITHQHRAQHGSRTRRWYFPIASALLLALTLLGFSDNLLTNINQPSNADPKFIAHGVFCLAWMIMLVVQANLAAGGNIRLHRRLGIAGMFIAVGVVLSTLWVFIAVWKGWDAMGVIGKANRILLPSYALCVLLAFLNRRRPDRHKRLIFVASLYMMEPVLSRAFDPFDPWLLQFSDLTVDTAWWVFFVTVWNALFLSLLAYDLKVDRRIHIVTIAGYGWFCAVWSAIWLL